MPGAVLTESAPGEFFLRESVFPEAILAYMGDRDTAAWERLRELLHLHRNLYRTSQKKG